MVRFTGDETRESCDLRAEDPKVANVYLGRGTRLSKNLECRHASLSSGDEPELAKHVEDRVVRALSYTVSDLSFEDPRAAFGILPSLATGSARGPR